MARRHNQSERLNYGRGKRTDAFADVESVLDQLEQRLATTAVNGGQNRALQEIQDRLDMLSGLTDGDMPARGNQYAAQAPQGFEHALADLKNELSQGFQKQFDHQLSAIQSDWLALAKDLRMQTQAGQKPLDLSSISDTLAKIQSSSAQMQSGDFAHKLDALRRDMNVLAREDSLNSLNRRWDSLEDHWQGLSAQLQKTGPNQDVTILADQLAQIEERLYLLPSNNEIGRVLEEIQALQAAVIHNGGNHGGAEFPIHEIETRLDEISRAIAAAPQSQAAADPRTAEKLFEIEATLRELSQNMRNRPVNTGGADLGAFDERLGALGTQIEATLAGTSEATNRLADIEQALSQLARGGMSGDASQSAIDVLHISEQVEDLKQKIDQATQHLSMGAGSVDTSAISSAIDVRLDAFLTELRHEAPRPEIASDPDAVAKALEAGFQDISQRLNAGVQLPSDDSALQALAMRLDAVTHLLEQPKATYGETQAPDMSVFEAQLAELAERVNTGMDSFASLSPKLSGIQETLERSGIETVEAARSAAESAIRTALEGFQLDVNHNSDPMIAQLASDVTSLQKLAKSSDGRNAKTFTAIHDTLLKIVNRLEDIETRPAAAQNAMQSKQFTSPAKTSNKFADNELSLADEPIEPHTDLPVMAEELPVAQEVPEKRKLTPIEAARAAAKAALSDKMDAAPELDPSQVFAQHIDNARDNSAQGQYIEDEVDSSGRAPDLDSILKKVRDQRAENGSKQQARSAPADLLASARRAAKAAASEAEMLKLEAENTDRLGESALKKLFAKSKRPLMLGAIGLVVVIAGLQLGGMFLGGGDEIDFAEPMTIENSELEPSSQANMADSPIDDAMDGARDSATDAQAAMDGEPTFEPEIPEVAMAPAPQEPVTSPLTEENSLEATPVNIDVPDLDFGTPALKAAINNGDPRAFFAVAQRYEAGQGTQADLTKAAQWYEQSAALDFAPAQFYFGKFLEKGRGVTRDLNQAKEWYQKAAKQGNTNAMYSLAVLFSSGAFGAQDHVSAGQWFAMAADYGVTDAQFNLGILQGKGLGMEKDLVQSYKWFAIAAKNGDSEAGRKRDDVASMMTPEALKEAQAFVDLWKPKTMDAEANSFSAPEEWGRDATTTASVDMKKVVLNIQRILNKNGYNAGTPDGVMGAKTRSAIRDFQKAEGLDPNGQVDDALVKALLAKNK